MTLLKARQRNLIAAALFLVLGVGAFAQMAGLDESGAASDPGAAGYPQLIASVMIVLAVLLALQHDGSTPSVPRKDALRVAGTVIVLIVYVATLEPLGYIASTIIMLIGAMLLMGIRSIPLLVIVPTGLALANFYVFYVAFGVPLPFTFIERLLS